MAFSNKVEDQAPKSTRREIHHIYDDDDDDDYQTKQDSTTIVEKEHMFDKVVTPSDVGKLNRLVIPKQHAEKYFPLDVGASSSIPTSETSAAKGILLNFEDSTGKPWRFRYSYWNSSQSYVMTKGWSRFVKDKRLDAGDTVSFGRYKDKLFIDWKHRPQITRPPNTIHSSSSSSVHSNFPVLSFSPYGQNLGYNVGGHGNNYVVFRSTVAAEGVGMPVVLESVPVVAQHREVGANSAKRVRLFGVNLDVPEGSSSSASPRGEEKEELSLDLDM